MNGPSEKEELFAVLEYMKGGQVATHPCAPSKKSNLSSGPRLLLRSQAHRRHLPLLLKFILNQRWWPSFVQSQGTPRRSPPPPPKGLLQQGRSQ